MEADKMCLKDMETNRWLDVPFLHPNPQISYYKDLPVSGAQASSALAALSTFCMLVSGEEKEDLRTSP